MVDINSIQNETTFDSSNIYKYFLTNGNNVIKQFSYDWDPNNTLYCGVVLQEVAAMVDTNNNPLFPNCVQYDANNNPTYVDTGLLSLYMTSTFIDSIPKNNVYWTFDSSGNLTPLVQDGTTWSEIRLEGNIVCTTSSSADYTVLDVGTVLFATSGTASINVNGTGSSLELIVAGLPIIQMNSSSVKLNGNLQFSFGSALNKILYLDETNQVTESTIDNAHLSYLANVTSDLQAQINGLQPIYTGNNQTVVVTDAYGSLTSSTITTAQLGYLGNVTSDLQTQINGLQPAFTGSDSIVVITDTNGNLASSTITSTQLGYLLNVNYDIQTQIDSKGVAFVGNDYVVVVTDENGNLTSSNITTTIIEYLANVTSDVQSQFNAIISTTGFGKIVYLLNVTDDIQTQLNNITGDIGYAQLNYIANVTSDIQTQFNNITGNSGYGQLGFIANVTDDVQTQFNNITGATGYSNIQYLSSVSSDIQGQFDNITSTSTYLANVTSDVQGQFNAITSTLGYAQLGYLANVTSDVQGQFTGITSTSGYAQLGYLANVTSDIQSQINALSSGGGGGGSGGLTSTISGELNTMFGLIDSASGGGSTFYTNLASSIFNALCGQGQITSNGTFNVQINDVGPIVQFTTDGLSEINLPFQIIDSQNVDSMGNSSYWQGQNSSLLIQNTSMTLNGLTNPNPFYLLNLNYLQDGSQLTSNPSQLNFINFQNHLTQYGYIGNNGSGGITYATVSDERLKSNITPVNNKTHYQAILNNPNLVKSFNLRNNKNQSIGCLAQEIQAIFPNAVNGNPQNDATKNPMSIDYGQLSNFLLSALSEAVQKINNLEKKVQVLMVNELNVLNNSNV